MNCRMGSRYGALAACALMLLFSANGPKAGAPEQTPGNENRIALLVTGWGPPSGYSADFNASVYDRAVVGDRANSANQSCTEWYLGTFPYRTEFGRVPYALAWQVKGFERLWDGYGIYRLDPDGKTYISALDAEVTLAVEAVADASISPVKDLPAIGTSRRFFFHEDPRDGTDHLAGWVKIDLPNGINDLKEMALMYSLRTAGMMGEDIEATPVKAKMQTDMEVFLSAYVADNFGDTVDLRYGYYAAVPDMTRTMEDVIVDFAVEGFRNFLVARETTDHNSVVADGWSRNHTLKALCQAEFSYSDEDITLKLVRQVGRTPEYNQMLVTNLTRHLEVLPKGSEVSIIYATHGQPWPGSNPERGPMSAGWQRVKDVTHENAYLNYLSFKRYAQAAFDEHYGGDYRLVFNKSGGVGSPESRTNSLFAAGMVYEKSVGDPDDPLRFATIRTALESAIRVDQTQEIVIVLSHWNSNTADTALIIREVNDLPMNSIAELKDGIFSITWCEQYSGPGQYRQMRPADGNCPQAYVRIQMTEAFDSVSGAFFSGYANRIRGGIERFGVFPDLAIEIAGQGFISKLDGGSAQVTAGPLAGAKLVVQPDPRPREPESYEWKNRFRPETATDPNTGPEAVRPINEFAVPDDYLDSAKDDFTAYIGTQGKRDPRTLLPEHPRAVSQTVYFGPYRTLFNAPATVTLPFDRSRVADTSRIKPYIYNEFTRRYDPVFPVPAGQPVHVNEEAGSVSFDVQVLGNFVLALD